MIERMSGFQSGIADAVRAQGRTTDEMHRTVETASTQAAAIATTMTAVARKRVEAKETVEATAAVAAELERLAAALTATTGRVRA